MSKATDLNFFLHVGMCLAHTDQALVEVKRMVAYAGDSQRARAEQIAARLEDARRLLMEIYAETGTHKGGDTNA